MELYTGILLMLATFTLRAHSAVVFSGVDSETFTGANVSLTGTTVAIQVSSVELLSGAELSVIALLGSEETVVFSPINYSHNTLPSPPFSLGGVDFPAQPSISIFNGNFTVTQIQANRIRELEFVTFSISNGVSQTNVELLSSVPEPSSLLLCFLAALAAGRRRR